MLKSVSPFFKSGKTNTYKDKKKQVLSINWDAFSNKSTVPKTQAVTVMLTVYIIITHVL